MTGEIEIPVDITAHAIEAVVGKFLEKTFVAEGAVRSNTEGLSKAECPDFALHTFIDIKSLPIRTDLDAVGRAEIAREQTDPPIGADPPDPSGPGLPIGIARIENAVGPDGDVVGLAHSRFMGKDADGPGRRIDPQNVVPGVIRNITKPGAVEAKTVAGASFGKGHPEAGLSGRSDQPDRSLGPKVDRTDIARPVAGRSLDALGELTRTGQRGGEEERLLLPMDGETAREE